MTERYDRKMTFPPAGWVSAGRSRATYCYTATGVFGRLHISRDRRRMSCFIRNKGRGDECINQIPCCAGSDRRRGAEWMHDWLLALSRRRSAFLCIFMERPSVFGCSNVTFLHIRRSALHTLNKHHYDVIIIIFVTRTTHAVHSKVLEEKENICNSV